MAIVAGDLLFRYSVVAAAGDTTASSGATSLGDQVSTSAWSDGGVLFDDVSGAENAASESEYRCVFALNNHGTLTAVGDKVYISSEVAGGASVAIGIDGTAKSAKTSGSAQAVTIANEDTAPSGVTFSTPTTVGAALSLGDLAPAEVKGIWVRRTTANSAPLNADGFTLARVCDTAE